MNIGIVGAGVMGRGVAERFATYGFAIILVDKYNDALNAAKKEIERSLNFKRMMNKELNVEDILKRICYSNDLKDLDACDFIVENVTEDKNVKSEIYKELDEVCGQKAIFLANTSCISITWLASITKRPDKVIGVHFMNPVPVKKFSEMIKGTYTSTETIDSVRTLLKSAEIDVEMINDSPGFVTNRLSHLFMNEAAFLVYENVASPAQIDRIFEEGFGHKMGPLKTADLIGLDTVLDSLKVLYEEYEDPKFRACPQLKKMVRAGNLGRKTGKGFFDYN